MSCTVVETYVDESKSVHDWAQLSEGPRRLSNATSEPCVQHAGDGDEVRLIKAEGRQTDNHAEGGVVGQVQK